MSKLITYETTEGANRIKSIKLEDVKLSYAFLLRPRPQDALNPGQYETDFLIYDKETVALLQEYFEQAVADGLEEWGNKLPKKFNKPFRKPDPEANPNEEGALLVLKAKTWRVKDEENTYQQPELFIREEGASMPRELTEEEVENFEITSGNIVEAFVVIHPYTYKGSGGIAAKVNAVCKTGEGTPFATGGKRINFVEGFSKTGFEVEEDSAPNKPPKINILDDDVVDDDEPEEVDVSALNILDDDEEDNSEETIDLASLVKTKTKVAPKEKATTPKKTKLSIESLLD